MEGSALAWLIRMLSHELQHACEIAHALEARNTEGVRRLYEQIGYSSGPNAYESAAALTTEARVWTELMADLVLAAE